MFWNSIMSILPGYRDTKIQAQQWVDIHTNLTPMESCKFFCFYVWKVDGVMAIVELKGMKFCFGRLEPKVSGEGLFWVKWLNIIHLWELGSIMGAGGTFLFNSYIQFIDWSCTLLLYPFLGTIATFLIYRLCRNSCYLCSGALLLFPLVQHTQAIPIAFI